MPADAPQRIVVVGGTSAIAQHVLRPLLAGATASVLLLGRDAARLERSRADLAARFPACTVTSEVVDLVAPAVVDAVTSRLTSGSDRPDLVLIAHASALSQDDGQESVLRANEQLMVTGVSPALWLQAFAERLDAGTIAVIGSVAGDRGRRRNYLYGAGKSMVATVAEGLQNRFAGTALHIVLVKPGPTATRLTADLEAAGARLADVRSVGRRIARGVAGRRLVVHAPPVWRPVMAVVRAIPAPLFNRLDL